MSPEEEFRKWWDIDYAGRFGKSKSVAEEAWLEAYRLGLTRAAEICKDINVNGKGGAPTCHQAILTERDKSDKP